MVAIFYEDFDFRSKVIYNGAMDFYKEKGKELPRLVYRNFTDKLATAANKIERNKVIDNFCDFINDLQPNGDWHKIKWCLPRKLLQVLSSDEAAKLNSVLAQKRSKRNARLLEAYPHCSDEYSVDTEFLDAAFGARRYSLLDENTHIFTIGSCFARNIARYLESKNFTVAKFGQMEDLNSPFSNAKMLSICAATPRLRKAYIEYWVKILYTGEEDSGDIVKKELQRLKRLREQIKNSEFMVITYGNILDYFLIPAVTKNYEFEIGPAVAPKFLLVSYSEDVSDRNRLTNKLKNSGAEFRIGNYGEVMQALESLHTSIRALNPDAHLLLTLSPIPIDSAIGLSHKQKLGAVEIDCISKSLLRAALHDFISGKADEKLLYFPSFEIVRWVAPNLDTAVFGNEDASSRHVSQEVLMGIYEYFLYKFSKTSEQAAQSEEVFEIEQALPQKIQKPRIKTRTLLQKLGLRRAS